jgi:hypothetical protein
MEPESANCASMVPRSTLEQQLPTGFVERHGWNVVVWDNISARLVKDPRMIWNKMSIRMV